MRRTLQLLATLLITLGVSCGMAATISVVPLANAEMRQFSPDLNLAGGFSMVSGKLGTLANGEIRRSILRFDLAGQVPAGAQVISATLSLHVVRVPMTPENSTFELRRLLSDWTEGDATWNSRLPGIAWQVPGADGELDRFPFPSSTVPVAGPGTDVFGSTPTLVSDIQGWVDDPSSNFGWLLLSQDEVSFFTARMFGTRLDAPNSPVLTITYIVVAPSPPSIQTQPQGGTFFVDADAQLSISASGTAPLSYQWFFNSVAIPGRTSAVLQLTHLGTNDTGDYFVTVSNAFGVTNSLPAHIDVIEKPPDIPVVRLLSPTNGARFPDDQPILLSADASVTNGTIVQIDYLFGTNVVATTNSSVLSVVTNLLAGVYRATARALTDRGNFDFTSTNTFSVLATPLIRLTSPVTNRPVQVGSNQTVTATVTSNGVSILQVQLLAKRFVTNASTGEITIETNILGTFTAPPYTAIWTPTVETVYTLVAEAVDEFFRKVSSVPLSVSTFAADSIRPSITITSAPPNFTRTVENSVRLAGTARDDTLLSAVNYQVNDDTPQLANGTTRWEAIVPLPPGKSSVRVWSVDHAFNNSPTNTRFFTHLVTNQLHIQIIGSGSVSPDLNKKFLYIGNVYRVTAKPDKDNLFVTWSNAPSQGAALNFEMSSNLILYAYFAPNPFKDLRGKYNGSFTSADTNSSIVAGSFVLSLSSAGAFSGKITQGHKRYSFTGRFDINGDASIIILRPGLLPLNTHLLLDLLGVTGITGTMTDGNSTALIEAPPPPPRH